MGLEPDGFDLDMTLIDSRRAIVAAFAAFAAVSRDTGTRIGLREVDSRLVIKLEDKLGF
jgi:phosphoglycolate phosphatase-like HAD superfamily hydrolase